MSRWSPGQDIGGGGRVEGAYPGRVPNREPVFEPLPDRMIREAMERGEFTDLPGNGRPIPGLEASYHPDWWARRYVERLREGDAIAQVAREVEHALGDIWPLPDEPPVRAAVGRLNDRLREANTAAPGSEPAPLLDPDEVVAIWRRMSAARRRPPGGAG